MLTAAGVPCGPINTIDGGVAFAERARPGPGRRRWVEGDAAMPTVRNPITVLRHAGPTTACRRPRSTSTARRSGAWLAAAPEEATPRLSRSSSSRRYPTSLGISTADTITLLGQDLAADLMGKVSFGELAYWLVTLRRPTPGRPGCSRPCWWRWPTTASPRPRSPPGSPTCPRRTRSRVRWPPGCSAAGPRFLGVTEDCGRFLHEVLAELDGDLPTDDAGWDALALAAVTERAGAGRVRARPGAPRAQGRRPADPGADPRSPPRRAWSARTWRCSRRSAGCTRRCSADVAAQRRRRLRRRAGRPRAAAGAAARLRPAGPGRRAARSDRRGAPPSDRQRHLPVRGPNNRSYVDPSDSAESLRPRGAQPHG